MSPASPEDIAHARKRIADGATCRAVAREMGRSHPWVSAHTRDLRQPRNRPFFVGVRLSPEEMDALDAAARANGRSWSAEMRARLKETRA